MDGDMSAGSGRPARRDVDEQRQANARLLGVAFLLQFVLYVPYVAFELVIGVWLLVRGFYGAPPERGR
jgi:hypothetical protein